MRLLSAVVVVCVVAVCSVGYIFLGSAFKNGTTQYVYVDADDTMDSVYVKLSEAGLKRTSAFMFLANHSDYADNVKTGRYAIAPGISVYKMFRHLQRGMQEPVNLTVPSVRTLDKLAAVLSSKLMMDSATIVNALYSQTKAESLGYDTATMPCLFIPNTYQIYWNVSVDDLLARMKKEHDAFWNSERMAKASAASLTPNEVTTIASIVDEETANDGEKPMVAGMYINRLKAGMPLQADPTIKFALKQFELKRIYNALLSVASPYNTYRNIGLPPGPIRIPTVAGIDAVLSYVHHDYMYMCAKEDFSGTHNFARTYAEHLQNAARYSAALNARGIK